MILFNIFFKAKNHINSSKSISLMRNSYVLLSVECIKREKSREVRGRKRRRMTEEEEEAYIAILEAENQRLRRILRLRLSQEKVKTSKKSS